MKAHALKDHLLERFIFCLGDMQETVSDREPVAQVGDEKLFLKVFSGTHSAECPLEKISFMLLENGLITSKQDTGVLDRGEFTVATFIPKDSVPAPLFALEVSTHYDKYIQCRADLTPLSTAPAYREAFCRPVQDLRSSLEQLPGLSPMTVLPGLENFGSGGLMAAQLAIGQRAIADQWIDRYTDLFVGFISGSERFPMLQDPAIVQEAAERKKTFRMMFGKMVPKILADIPHFTTEELPGMLRDNLF